MLFRVCSKRVPIPSTTELYGWQKLYEWSRQAVKTNGRRRGGTIELTGTDFFMFLSSSETPRRSCSRKLLRCTIISVYRYIAAVRQAQFLWRGSIRTSQVPQRTHHSLSRRHSTQRKNVVCYFWFLLFCFGLNHHREKWLPVNKVNRSNCFSSQVSLGSDIIIYLKRV
jgi:hypothetical protein